MNFQLLQAFFARLKHLHPELSNFLHRHDDDYSAFAHNHNGSYATPEEIESLQETDSEIIINLGSKAEATHDHSGSYAEPGHTHTDWRDLQNTKWAHIRRSGANQVLTSGANTVIQVDTVTLGNTDLYDSGIPYTFKGVEGAIYFLTGQVYWTGGSNITHPMVRIIHANGTFYTSLLQGLAVSDGTIMQVSGILQGYITSVGGVTLVARHSASGDRSIAHNGQTWLAGFQIGLL